jgi:hypothetical protein
MVFQRHNASNGSNICCSAGKESYIVARMRVQIASEQKTMHDSAYAIEL